MIKFVYTSKISKIIAVYLVISLLSELFFPNVALALTGGPSQPEVQSFEPVGTSDMVDPFTGDFNYNIPLFDIEGYPVNISYHSGITMDQEASFVGLGWNLNVGCITRNMRGLPDDFKGDEITKTTSMKDNISAGLMLGAGAEVFGCDDLHQNASGGVSFGLNITYNNYVGLGLEETFNISNTLGKAGASPWTGSLGIKSSSEGLDVSPNISYGRKIYNEDGGTGSASGSISIGTSFNSRRGLKQLTIGIGVSETRPGLVKVNNEDVANPTVNGTGKGYSNGLNGGSSISFCDPSYVPQVQNKTTNSSWVLSVKVGTTFSGFDGSWNIGGSFSRNRIKDEDKIKDSKAYGYLYSDYGANDYEALHDFNREKDGGYTKDLPNLPVTNLTYDVYNVMGQGVGGTYRPMRNDVGVVYDAFSNSESNSNDIGGEISLGNIAQGGFDMSITDVTSFSGKWTSSNSSNATLGFKKGENIRTNYPDYESVYFKQAGEKNVDQDPDFLESYGGYDPVMVELDGHKLAIQATNNIVRTMTNGTTATTALPAHNTKTKSRQKRNQVFSYLTMDEAISGGFQKNDPDFNYSAIYSSRPSHHIGEVSILRPDGFRYFYGLPVYNTYQKEVTMSVDGSVDAFGQVTYDPVEEDSKNNKSGLDGYYNKTEMGPYAHSYMLTAVVSADYVDISGDGPSNDDLGTYTKFTYTCVPGYKWRTPYGTTGTSKANFNEGLKTQDMDNKGSYVFGEKDVYYLEKIETKNYVARFTMVNRMDAYGVNDDKGGLSVSGNSKPSKLLKQIDLYSKTYYQGGSTENLIKTVHFVYDYSLCKNVNNNDVNDHPSGNELEYTLSNEHGKLTLKQIYFTYGASNRARFNKYEFTYGDVNHDGTIEANPDYNMKAYDRWGNYKPLPTGLAPPNDEFPYVEQNKTSADLNAAAWSLTDISLPSGGKISVDLESDDYAYVQDKQAMEMFKVIGASGADPDVNGEIPTNTIDDMLYSSASKKNQKICIKINNTNEPINSRDDIIPYVNRMLEGDEYLYFRFLVNVNYGPKNNGMEYVSGYAKINKDSPNFYYGMVNGCTDRFWIELQPVKLGNNVADEDGYNPVSKASWQFARLNTPRQAFGNLGEPDPNVSAKDILLQLAGMSLINNVIDAFRSPNGKLKSNDLGKTFDCDKSWVRLNSPYKQKFGGGNRVKKIMINDLWDVNDEYIDAQSPTGSNVYGQEYSYVLDETVLDPTGQPLPVSSGVATYEPQIGGDENPFRQPVFYDEKAILAPDSRYYQEEPFGESFFPSPSVGYSRVKVANIKGSNVTRHGTGYIIHEFFTAKDYPVITRRTEKIRRPYDPFVCQLLNFDVKNYETTSEGYVIELNDMHGKPKAQWVYSENMSSSNTIPKLISGVEYFYKDNGAVIDGKRTRGNKLINDNIPVVNPNGKVESGRIGVDYDIVADSRESNTYTNSFGMQMNIYGFVVGIVPVIVPPIWFSAHTQHQRFRSSVITKVINRYGILDETVAYDMGSKVSTCNLAYDSETGEVLLTKTKNMFNDDQYSFTYPSHWIYEGMGLAYKNIGFFVKNGITVQQDKIIFTGSDIIKGFTPGDEVLINHTYNGLTETEKYWVLEAKDIVGTGDYIQVSSGEDETVDFTGYVVNSVKVVRSGRRNMQTVPVGTLLTKESPIVTVGLDTSIVVSVTTGILNAAATEFNEWWRIDCPCRVVAGEGKGNSRNPYLGGLRGIWRPQKSYVYTTDRTQTINGSNNVNLRNDGVFASFAPFWNENSHSGKWDKTTDQKWKWTTEITQYSPNGYELENKSALDIFSSAVYGYNNSLPIAVAKNAQYKEIGYDGFEDYDYNQCDDPHFSYMKELEVYEANPQNVGYGKVTEVWHTGRHSLKIKGGTYLDMSKKF